jgi:hypothetical protein
MSVPTMLARYRTRNDLAGVTTPWILSTQKDAARMVAFAAERATTSAGLAVEITPTYDVFPPVGDPE